MVNLAVPLLTLAFLNSYTSTIESTTIHHLRSDHISTAKPDKGYLSKCTDYVNSLINYTVEGLLASLNTTRAKIAVLQSQGDPEREIPRLKRYEKALTEAISAKRKATAAQLAYETQAEGGQQTGKVSSYNLKRNWDDAEEVAAKAVKEVAFQEVHFKRCCTKLIFHKIYDWFYQLEWLFTLGWLAFYANWIWTIVKLYIFEDSAQFNPTNPTAPYPLHTFTEKQVDTEFEFGTHPGFYIALVVCLVAFFLIAVTMFMYHRAHQRL